MAEKEHFSSENFNDIPVTMDEVAAASLDSFFNSSDEDLEEIGEEDDEVPQQKKQVKPPVKKAVQKTESEETEEEEEEDELLGKPSTLDKLLNIEEEVEESSEEEGDTPPTNEEDELNRYQELTNEFVDLGMITLDDDEESIEINSPEELVARLQKEHKKAAAIVLDQFLSKFGDDYKEAFDAIFVNQVDPREYFTLQHQIEDMESLDMSSLENQKKIFRQHFKNLGLDEERIEARLQKSMDYGDLEDDAKDFHKVLVQKYKDEKEQKLFEQEQENNRKAQQKNLYVQSMGQILRGKLAEKEFDGLPLDANTANETFKFLTEDRYRTPDGQTLTEFDKYILDLKKPDNFEKRVKLAMLAQMLETDPTLSKIQKRAITKETKKVFGKVVKHLDKQKTPLDRKRDDDKITSFI